MSHSRSSSGLRWARALAVLAVTMLIPAVASAETPGHFRGVITAHTAAGRAYRAQVHPAHRRASANLTYHGGPIMHADRNYAIYWSPTGSGYSANYQTVINGFFGNVAAANGQTTNDYSVATQYSDTAGNFADNASSGGALADADPYPASGCRAGSGGPCLTDAQLQTELNSYLTAHNLPRGMGTMYFVYFPSGVTTCFDSSGSQCSSNVYCAYHSSFGSGATPVLYGDMPYAGVSGFETGQYPNGDTAGDSATNVTSHENIEAITDPLGNAWYDASGNEIGDKCNFNFGAPLGGPSGVQYNEQISSDRYSPPAGVVKRGLGVRTTLIA
jgi:hypothetical protein